MACVAIAIGWFADTNCTFPFNVSILVGRQSHLAMGDDDIELELEHTYLR